MSTFYRAGLRPAIALGVFTLLAAASAGAGTFTVFGPKSYTRATGAPEAVRETFAARNTALGYTLEVDDGSGGRAGRVTSAVVTLNGVAVLGPKDFNASTSPLIRRAVRLAASNVLEVELRGAPGAGATVRITGVDDDPPVIRATVDPAPNAAGWNNTPVTVTFACEDATSGIVSCSEPVRLDAGVGEVVSGSAADAAGNTASASVTVDIDTQAPFLEVGSPVGGEGTNAASVAVAGRAADNDRIASFTVDGRSTPLIAEVFHVTLPLRDGANTIEFSAADRAGNVSTIPLQITRYSVPAVAITSPDDLAILRTATVTISGTVSDPAATVQVNGLPALVSGTEFTARDVPLAQGRTVITATATNARGRASTSNILLYRDSIPPRVAVRYPADGATVYQTPIDVSGMVDDIVVGTINSAQMRITVNGVEAEVANRAFAAHGVSLAPGPNALVATATDAGGNAVTLTTRVAYQPVTTQPQLVAVSGGNQTGTIRAELPQPLIVRAVSAAGAAMPGQIVTFEVVENDGTLRSGTATGRTVTAATDAQGRASVFWTLGSRAGAGNHRVSVRAPGFTGGLELEAIARTGAPAMIVVDSGNNQFAAGGTELPRPLLAIVVDAGGNRLANVPVTFSVVSGGGSFAGETTATVTTDSDGRAWITPAAGPAGNNIFHAAFPGAPSPAAFVAISKVAGDPAATRISGVIFDNTDQPVPGTSVRIEGTTLVAQADDQGQFTLTQVPVGYVKLIVDGSTARRPGAWPMLEYAMYAIPGANNTLEMPIHILPIDTRRGVLVDETTGGTITLPELPGFSLTIAPGSVTFPGGSRTGTVSVTLVHTDKVPMAPGFGQQPRFIVTIQPAGAHFDPPAQITFPNVDGLAPGQVTELYSFDHDLGQFVSIGTGSVSADGTVLRSDPGIGIIKAGWHCGGNPVGAGTSFNCPTCKKYMNNDCIADAAKEGSACGNGRICRNGICTCPAIINYRQVGAYDAGGGTLHFDYAWDSDTGDLQDLNRAGCEIGELVSYPRIPWPPSLPANSPRNPTITWDLAGRGRGHDDQYTRGTFVKPYRTTHFVAQQQYRYKCPCRDNNFPVVLMGPHPIVREVISKGDGTWRFQITKTGAKAQIDPLP